jgi:DNA-binding transcriptional LysR family regulator
VAVVDAGGFTRAARALRTAQPAVSLAIRKLERELGATLLVRSPRGVMPTEEGARFLEHARAILAHEAGARRDVQAVANLETGQLTLGVPPMVAATLLPRILERFVARHPGLRVVVVQAGADEISARVLRGTLDLGLIADWRRVDGLLTRLLVREPVVVCVAAAHPWSRRNQVTWADLLAQPLVAFPRGYYQRALLDEAARRLKVEPRIVVEAESIPLIAELVRRGRGAATLLAMTAAELSGIRTIALPDGVHVPIALCRRADAEPSPAARAFERILRDNRG